MMTKGITLLEILFGIAIALGATTIVAISLTRVNQNAALETSVDTAISVLNEARAMTLASKNALPYSVSIEAGQLGLHTLTDVRNINIAGGGSTITFKRLTGSTDNYGTFEIYLKEATTTYKTIKIDATGIVEKI